MHEPGLDLHQWETEWQALEPELADSPAAALPELHDLVGRMLAERGLLEAEDSELVREYEAASDVVRRVEAAAGSCDPGDIAQAIEGLRAIYDTLVAERAAP